jgi:hypothetical protein
MLIAKEVVNSLHGVERSEWNFYEDCVPIAHSSIPETRKLESLEFLTTLAL